MFHHRYRDKNQLKNSSIYNYLLMRITTSPARKVILPVAALVLLYSYSAMARVGGAGGHSGGGSHSSSHGFGGGGGGGLGIPLSPGMIVIIIIAIVLYTMFKNKLNPGGNNGQSQPIMSPGPQHQFPEGLTPEKAGTSFMELQQAWQQQDLSKVRKWMSDGVYQRFTAQFAMMKKLTQYNRLSNIRIHNIAVASINTDGAYQTADVAISFSMDDEFISQQYPSLNESYEGDTDTEYWTFIKRTDSKPSGADLYHTDNCPNCGAPLEDKLGEVSRCLSCKTLTNNAAYDWVLSEITQMEDYGGKNPLLNDANLHELVKNDPLFSIQRMEDIASNVFMQIMEVFTGDNNKKLLRFAEASLAEKLIEQKASAGSFVFDRLYLNDVTLSQYNQANEKLNLMFTLSATYQRVQLGSRLTALDQEMDVHRFKLVLSKDLAALNKPQKEIAFSYECASCGAPYDDTTNDTCSYCDALVVDTAKNWVLTDFGGY